MRENCRSPHCLSTCLCTGSRATISSIFCCSHSFDLLFFSSAACLHNSHSTSPAARHLQTHLYHSRGINIRAIQTLGGDPRQEDEKAQQLDEHMTSEGFTLEPGEIVITNRTGHKTNDRWRRSRRTCTMKCWWTQWPKCHRRASRVRTSSGENVRKLWGRTPKNTRQVRRKESCPLWERVACGQRQHVLLLRVQERNTARPL